MKKKIRLDLGGEESPPPKTPKKLKKVKAPAYVEPEPTAPVFEPFVANNGAYALFAYTLFRYYYYRSVRLHGAGFKEADLLKKTGNILREWVKRCGAKQIVGNMQQCIDNMSVVAAEQDALKAKGTYVSAFDEIGLMSAVREYRAARKKLKVARCVALKDKDKPKKKVRLEC